MRKSSTLKAGCNNESTYMTPRTNNELFAKYDQLDKMYV